MMKKFLVFGLIAVLLIQNVLASPESDAERDITNQQLGPCHVEYDGAVVHAAYTLPETKDLKQTSVTAYVVMAYLFKSFPEAVGYEIYQYVGPLAVTKYTVATSDVAAVLFEGMPASKFWQRVSIEEIPEAPIEPSSGNVMLGFIIIFGFLAIVGIGVYYAVKSFTGKKGKKK